MKMQLAEATGNSDVNRLMNRDRVASLFDYCFRDNAGRIVIAQFPNMPLFVAVGLWLLRSLFASSGDSELLWTGSIYGALFVWAFLEILHGVNWWRRFLGAVVAVWLFLQFGMSR